MHRVLVAVAFTLGCLLPGSAQVIPAHDHLPDTSILIDASVEDRKTGQTITGLTADDFLLQEDRVQQTITYVSEDRLPLSILLLFDLTDTVQPVLHSLASGAREFVNRLRPEDEVAVAVFSNHIYKLQTFSHDRAAVQAAITRAARLHDATAFTYVHDAVFRATQFSEAGATPGTRRVQVWLTDGTSNYPSLQPQATDQQTPEHPHSKEEAVKLVNQSSTVVNVLSERSYMTAGQFQSMVGETDQYAELTGGAVVRSSEGSIVRDAAALADTLHHRYTLGFRPSEQRPAGTLCHLTLALRPSFLAAHPELSARSVRIRTRQSYVR